MTKTRVSACAFVVAASLAGCRSTGEVDYAGEVRVTSPERIEVRPGVQVIADADEPLFYSGGAYWLYRDGYWFRSRDYRGGFARVEYTAVPEPVRVIEQPQRYVHYRANLGRTRHARTPETRTRSARPYPPPSERPAATPPPPTYPVPPESPDYPTDLHSPRNPDVPGARPSGINPTQPTTPPAADGTPTTVPNDHRREPEAQRNAPAEVERSAPDVSREHVNRQDRADQATPPARNNTDNRTDKRSNTSAKAPTDKARDTRTDE